LEGELTIVVRIDRRVDGQRRFQLVTTSSPV
jgi:hypothetical protein